MRKTGNVYKIVLRKLLEKRLIWTLISCWEGKIKTDFGDVGCHDRNWAKILKYGVERRALIVAIEPAFYFVLLSGIEAGGRNVCWGSVHCMWQVSTCSRHLFWKLRSVSGRTYILVSRFWTFLIRHYDFLHDQILIRTRERKHTRPVWDFDRLRQCSNSSRPCIGISALYMLLFIKHRDTLKERYSERSQVCPDEIEGGFESLVQRLNGFH